jgi:dipeptidyl aminopeptidase/acylaminoacyl peptidase
MTSIAASVPLIPRAHLFGNPARTQTRISPTGRFIAWLAPDEGVLNIWVAPLAAPDQARAVTGERKRGIRAYVWAYDGKHLVYLQDKDGDENYHVLAVDPEAGTTRDLTPFEGVNAQIIAVRPVYRDRILIQMNRRDRRFFDVFLVDLATGALTPVLENPGFMSFVVDDHYRVRFGTKYGADGSLAIERRGPDGGWMGWAGFPPEDARSSKLGHLNADGTAVFLSDSRGRDTAVLVRIDLSTGEARLLAEDPRADLGEVLMDGPTKEPLAYVVNVERRAYIALDPAIQPDLDFLAAQQIGDWSLSSRTEDDALWVVSGSSDVSPGADYLYDRRGRSLRKLHDTRPELAGAPLAPMRPVTIRARDGLDLVSYVTRPLGADGPGPMVLLVHGGPWARDVFACDPMHQWLANRGYTTISVNFRGSTGLGKTFINASDHEWGRRMDDDLLDAVAWAVDRGLAAPGRIAIMGGSYGGYAVLAGMTRNPETYACGVDIVGPSNLETLLATIPPYWEAMRAMLTKAVGDPATAAGLALMRERSPVHHADRLRRPLLIAQGANDPRVKQAESDQMVAAMRAKGIPVTYLLYPDEGHGFARPANNIVFNAVAETFLARHLGGRAEKITSAEIEASTMQILEGGEGLGLPE